jgi:hypothetical protein
MQTLMCFDNCSSVSVRQEVYHVGHTCMWPTGLDTPANEDAKIAAMERMPLGSSHDIARKLGSHPRALEVLHDDQLDPYICLQTIAFFGCNSANGYDSNTVWMRSFCITSSGNTRHVLRVRVCSASTTVTSGHRLILTQSPNVGNKSACGPPSQSWPSSEGDQHFKGNASYVLHAYVSL